MRESAPTCNSGCLKGARVLVVEDNYLIALDLEQMLVDLGADEVAIATSIDQAQVAIRDRCPTLAVLDVDLGGTASVVIADTLAAQGVGFIFVTGFGEGLHISDAHRHVAVVDKPADPRAIKEALARLLG